MGIEGSWSGMRKYLEKEMLADSLKGRIRYGCTKYICMEGSRIFEVCIDDKQVKRFSWETLQTYLKENGDNEYERSWCQLWYYVRDNSVESRDVYVDIDFCDALTEYRNQDIKISLQSNNPIVRMFAILDRRVGKRTLEKLKESVAEQPEWLKRFYLLRLEAENI